MNAYADTDALTAWLPSDATVPADAERLLSRASELIDQTVLASYTVDDDGIPTDSGVAQALSDAACAQVEFWMEVGEEHDIDGLAGSQASAGSLNVHKPGRLPENGRAMGILRQGRLLSFGMVP